MCCSAAAGSAAALVADVPLIALDPLASETLAARFRPLSEPTRVAIVNRLASTAESCVCDVNAAFDLSQPTISHHLKVLRDARLVESSRRGTWPTTDSSPTR